MATAGGEAVPRHLVTPPGLKLKESGVGDGTKGVFCLTPIAEGQMYGPYAGEVILEGHDSKVDYRYAWEVYDPNTNELMHIINATKPETGNWMRYVNCARYFEEQNIVSVQVGSEIFYKAIRHIPANEELLTWFSLSYQMQNKKKKKRKSVDILDTKESETSKKKRKSSSTSEPSPPVVDDMKTPLLYEMMTSNSKYSKTKPISDETKKQPKLTKSKSTGSIDVNMLKGGMKPPNTPTKKPQTANNTPIKDLMTIQSTPSPGNTKKGNCGSPKKSLKVKDLIAMQAAKNARAANAETSPLPNKLPIPKLKSVFSTSPKIKGQPKVKADGPVDLALAGMVLHSEHQANLIYQFELRREHHVEKQGRKMYTCDICMAPYSHAFSLKRHFLRSHINAKYLPLSDITNCLINVVQQEEAVKNCKNNADRLTKEKTENKKKSSVKSKCEGEKVNESEREVTLPGVFRCYLCSELFDDLEEMRQHTKDHPLREKAVKKFSCEKCDMKFTHKNNLTRHQEVHSESNPTSCPVCGKSFSKESNMKKHLQFHQNKSFTCTACAEKFTTIAELRKHVRMEHAASDTKMAAQLKQIGSGRDKNARAEANGEPVRTVKIDQIKKKKMKLKVRKLAQMSPGGKNKNTSVDVDPNKTVPCPICNKRFSTVPSMKKHAQFHGNRRFTCRYCKEKFPHPFGLRKHLWSLHTTQMKQNLSRTTGVMRKVPTFKQKLEPANQKPLQQTDAEKSADEKLVSNVKQETRSENKVATTSTANKTSVEKPYSCRVCGKAFPSEANMKMHLQYHFGRTFSCRFCFKKFPHPASLRKHLNAEHPEGMANGVLIKNKPDIIIGPDGKRLKRKRKKKIKTELELMLTSGGSGPVKESTENTEVKKEENEENEGAKTPENDFRDLDEADESEEEDLWEEEIRITKELQKKARLHFSCILCKKKFNSYVNMCRHKRLAHRVKKYGMPTLTRQRIAAKMQDTVIVNDYLPITPAEFYSNVAENIATNLDQYIDGKQEALTNYEKHVSIPEYHSLFEVTPEATSPIEWSKYNFPKSFTPWEGIASYEVEEDTLNADDKIAIRDERAARRRLRRSRSSSDASFDIDNKDILDDSSNQEAVKTLVKVEPNDDITDESNNHRENEQDESLKLERGESETQLVNSDNGNEMKDEEKWSGKDLKFMTEKLKSESDVKIIVNEDNMVENNQATKSEVLEISAGKIKSDDETNCPENENVSKHIPLENKCVYPEPKDIQDHCESSLTDVEYMFTRDSESEKNPEGCHCESEFVSQSKCKGDFTPVTVASESIPHSKTFKQSFQDTEDVQAPVCNQNNGHKELDLEKTMSDGSEYPEPCVRVDSDVEECLADMVERCDQMDRGSVNNSSLPEVVPEIISLNRLVSSSECSELEATEPNSTDSDNSAGFANHVKSVSKCDKDTNSNLQLLLNGNHEFNTCGTKMDIPISSSVEKVSEQDNETDNGSGCAVANCAVSDSLNVVELNGVEVCEPTEVLAHADNTFTPIYSETSDIEKVAVLVNGVCSVMKPSDDTVDSETKKVIEALLESVDSATSEHEISDVCKLTEDERVSCLKNLTLPGKGESEVTQGTLIVRSDFERQDGIAENIQSAMEVTSGLSETIRNENKNSGMEETGFSLKDKCVVTKDVVGDLASNCQNPGKEQLEGLAANCKRVPSLYILAANSMGKHSEDSQKLPVLINSHLNQEVSTDGSISDTPKKSEFFPGATNIVKVDQIPGHYETEVVDNSMNDLELDAWVREVVLSDIIKHVVRKVDSDSMPDEDIPSKFTVTSFEGLGNKEVAQETKQEVSSREKDEDNERDHADDVLVSQKDSTVDSDIKQVVESILCEVASNNITSDLKQMLEGNNNICSLKVCVKESLSRSEDLENIDSSSASSNVLEKESVHTVVSEILSDIISSVCSGDLKRDLSDFGKLTIQDFCPQGHSDCESSQMCVMETYEQVLKSPTSMFKHLRLVKWNEVGKDELMVNISDEEIPPQGPVIRCRPTLQLSPVPSNNFSSISFGSNGQVNYVCSVCKKHFLDTDALLRHHLKKHPSIDFSFIEVENGNDIDLLFYTWPCNYGLLATSQPFQEDCRNLDIFTCTRCGSTFKHIHRLHVHIINCDPKNYETLAAKRRKYRKKMRKQMMEAMRAKRTEQGKPATPVESPRKPGRPKGVFGSRKKKGEVSSDSPTKNRKRRNYELLYNPHNHVRRREMTDVLETHQCHGCENTFKTLSLLERHAKKCSGRDKLQKMKPVQNTLLEEMAQKPRHTCRYCSKHFTYLKSLANHYRAFCSVRKSRQQKGLLMAEDLREEEDLLKLIKRLELAKLESKEAELEETSGRKKKGGWPRGMKRKNRRKRHCWTYVKKKKPDEKDGAEGSLFDPLLWNPEVDWMEQLLLPGQGEEEDDSEEDEEEDENSEVIEKTAKKESRDPGQTEVKEEVKSTNDTKKNEGKEKGTPTKTDSIPTDTQDTPSKVRKLKSSKTEDLTDVKVESKSSPEASSPTKKCRKSTENKNKAEEKFPPNKQPNIKSKEKDTASTVELALEGVNKESSLQITESEGVCSLSMSDGSSGTPGSSPEKKKRKYVRKIPLEEVLLKKKRNRMLKMKLSEETLSNNQLASDDVQSPVEKKKGKKNLGKYCGTGKNPTVSDIKESSSGVDIVKPALAIKTASSAESSKNKILLDSGTVTLITVFPSKNGSFETSTSSVSADSSGSESPKKFKRKEKSPSKEDLRSSPKKNSKKTSESLETNFQKSPKETILNNSPKRVSVKISPTSKVLPISRATGSSVVIVNAGKLKPESEVKSPKKTTPKKQIAVSAMSGANETVTKKTSTGSKPKTLSPKKNLSKCESSAKIVNVNPDCVTPRKSPGKGKTTPNKVTVSPKSPKVSPKTMSAKQSPVKKSDKGSPTLMCFERLSDNSSSPDSRKNSPTGKCPAKKRKKNQAVSSLLCEEDPDFLFDSDECSEVVPRKKIRPQLAVVPLPVLAKQMSEIGQESDISR